MSARPKNLRSEPKQLRSTETRIRLLDATIACIEQLGYRETTVARITEKAGVSVGAYMHHFPTKDQLMADALDHLYDQRMIDFERQVGGMLAHDAKHIDQILDSLRRLAFSNVFAVANEFLVAQRTDTDLRTHAHALSLRHRTRMRQVYESVFGLRAIEQTKLMFWLDGTFNFLLRGLSIVAVGRSESEVEESWRFWKQQCRRGIMEELSQIS